VVPTGGLNALEDSNYLFAVPGIECLVPQQVAQCCTVLMRWKKSKVRVTVAVTAVFVVKNHRHHHNQLASFSGPISTGSVSFMRPSRHRLRPARWGVL